MALSLLFVDGFATGIQAGDRVEIRNVTQGVSVIHRVDAIATDGTGKVTMEADVSMAYSEGDLLYLRRLDENEEYPEYNHAISILPSGLTFNRSDMLKLASDIGHVARPIMIIEES